ncbi:MAG TPA: tetratricopeptide repeat protein [Paracoccaceae bacterium]|nr:tetratricopeptide repeat protein [Paracoccaceae bacterium]
MPAAEVAEPAARSASSETDAAAPEVVPAVPAPPPTPVEAAAARLAAGDAEAAERAFRRLLLTRGPDDLHALVGLGAALSRQGRSAEAEAILVRAVERWPRSAAARNNLAAVRLSLGRRQAALSELAVARRLAEAEGSAGLLARIDRNIALAGGALSGPDPADADAGPGPATAAPDASAPTHRLIPRGAGRWRLEPAPADAPPPPDVPEDSA